MKKLVYLFLISLISLTSPETVKGQNSPKTELSQTSYTVPTGKHKGAPIYLGPKGGMFYLVTINGVTSKRYLTASQKALLKV